MTSVQATPTPSGTSPVRQEVYRQVSASTNTTSAPSTFGSIRTAFQRALSPNRPENSSGSFERRPSLSGRMSQLEEGRGRQPIVSTGRGGAGNLVRSASRGVDPDVTYGVERGREVRDVSRDRIDRLVSSGRGGAGNIRSPSRGPQTAIAEAKEDALQARLVAEERGRQAQGNYSTGRGGAGNMSRSKSRSRSAVRNGEAAAAPAPTAHHEAYISGGRGGWGNIREEHDTDRDSIDEAKLAAERKYESDVRAKHLAEEAGKPHSSGKGGAGNIAVPGPDNVDMSKLTLEEREAYAKVHAHDSEHGRSSGRGGGGNIHKPSHHGHDEDRGRGQHGLFGNVMRSLSRAAAREKSSDRKAD